MSIDLAGPDIFFVQDALTIGRHHLVYSKGFFQVFSLTLQRGARRGEVRWKICLS